MNRYLPCYLLVACLACQSEPADLETKCRDVQEKVNGCLVDYCVGSGDEICRSVSTSQRSAFPDESASVCRGMSGGTMDELLAADCAAIVETMRDSLSGKADAPCPAYLPWCTVTGGEGKGYDVRVLHYDWMHATLEVTIRDLTLEGVVEGGAEYEKLSIEGDGTTTVAGAPALPVLNLLVGAPPDVSGAVVTGLQKLDVHSTPDVTVWPYQPLARETDGPAGFALDAAAYDRVEAWPGVDHRVDPVAVWRNYKAVRVVLHPVQYFARERRLEVARRLVVDIDFRLSDSDSDVIAEGESSFAAAYDSAMVNYAELRDMAGPVRPDPDRVRYLVIVADAFDEAVQPLLKLKDGQFLRTKRTLLGEVVPERSSEKNVDAQKIKDHIRAVYEDQGIEYVLLVGDVEDIPMYEETMPGSWEPVVGDYWYSCLAGDDLLPEVAVGRLVGKTPEEISAQVAKIVAYETGDRFAPWRQKVLLVTHKQEAPKKYTQCSESIRTGRYGYPASFVTLYGHEDHTNQELIDRLNSGVGIVNYRGHGSETAWTGWNDDDFAFGSLESANAGRTPVVFSIACLTGKLSESGETLAEAMTKRPDGGAVAFLGATAPSWTLPNHDYDRQLFRSILDRGIRQIGKLSNVAAVETMTQWGNDQNAVENVKMYFWLGDPSLDVDLGSAPRDPVPVGWCNLQHPHALVEKADVPATDVFGRVWAEGHTELPGQAPFLLVQVGYGPVGTSPVPLASDAVHPAWTWSGAYYNLDADHNDEYMTRLLVHEPGEYSYVFRVSGDGGRTFTYCDIDGSANGLAPDQLGRVTIEPRPTMTVASATLSWPHAFAATAGSETTELRSSLSVMSETFDEQLVPFVRAQVGHGPAGTLPTESADWVWSDAKYKNTSYGTLNYTARLTPAEPGTRLFTFRYSMDDGATWTYADKDGSANGLALDQLGQITVNPVP
ncbi:MAG: hypothetical protein JXB32_05330 [Deltaproteobacteria bacterium]|nr:hypothetical protein [Deltaproteobacteria bacterium]